MGSHTTVAHADGLAISLPGAPARIDYRTAVSQIARALSVPDGRGAESCAVGFLLQLLNSPIFIMDGPARDILCQQARLSTQLLHK